MKRVISLIAVAIVCTMFGCKAEQTKVIEVRGKVETVQVKGFTQDLHVEVIEIEGVEYLIFYDDSKHFSICPKVNGKHAK